MANEIDNFGIHKEVTKLLIYALYVDICHTQQDQVEFDIRAFRSALGKTFTGEFPEPQIANINGVTFVDTVEIHGADNATSREPGFTFNTTNQSALTYEQLVAIDSCFDFSRIRAKLNRSLTHDFGLGYHNVGEFQQRLEEYFGIELSDRSLDNFDTVQHVVNAVKRALKPRNELGILTAFEQSARGMLQVSAA